jgi:hypothetical protein
MQTLQVTSETTLQHHLEALGNNDLDEVMKDYTEQSEVWTPQGAMVGLQDISSFFSYGFTLLPKGKTRFEIKQMIVKEEKVFIVWDADTEAMSVPMGTDSFLIVGGKILWQSTAFHLIKK